LHPTISPSNVEWLSCHKRFHTLATLRKYKDEKGKPPVLKFASMIHKCLAQLYDPAMAGDRPHADQLDAILNGELMQAGYKDAEDREFARDKARRLLRAYLRQQDAHDAAATVAVERTGYFHVRVKGQVLYSLTARIDRILALGDTAVALDYKTGQALPSSEMCFVNTAILKALMPGFANYEFWCETISDEGADRTVYRGAEMKGMVHLVTKRVQRYLAVSEYVAEPYHGCRFCPLNEECQGEHNTVDEDDLDF
jgi:hypothetical protein